MKLPRYWAKGTVETIDSQGKPLEFSCWGWSSTSQSDAQEIGRQRAEKVATHFLQGDMANLYLYSDRPLREELIEEFHNAEGAVFAGITRNAYGCQILNTATMMFVDIDLPLPNFSAVMKHLFQKMLGKTTASLEEQQEKLTLEKIESVVQSDARQSMRVYRTRAGLRCLLTDRLHEPNSDSTRQIMQAFDADPMYIKLCHVQQSFRARLTPKPWRCGIAALTARFPWANKEVEKVFQQWNRRYQASADRFATCRFLCNFGSGNVLPEIAPIIELHDALTRCDSKLKLA